MQMIKIAYADVDITLLVDFCFDGPTTIEQAIKASGILDNIPGIDHSNLSVGVYGKLKSPGDPVCDGDRIEIYRPLKVDPKTIRRQRAEQQHSQGKKR